MYIKSIVIDGFKSYGTRTEVQDFDPQFNAITGLNGSGKSNILDSICFLLGITNLSHVRAQNLQELVYKNGQAGVTKASVSITFDNRDKSKTPLGYESYDEIVITRSVVLGGKNRYLINGTNIQNNRVNDLFRSVQLNINNPHFLIMQGRITKVLNMKPPEILSMLEEAAGTRMYESKKQNAQKTIEKKDAKLKEIDNILKEEINPTLAKLKQERNTYLEYQKIQRELEHLTKLYVAYKFISAEKANSRLQTDLEAVNKTMDGVRTAISHGLEEIKKIAERIITLEKERDEELGGKLEELEEALKNKSNNCMKLEASLKSLLDNKKLEAKKCQQIQRGMDTDKKALCEKQKINDGLKEVYDVLRDEDERATKALAVAQKRYEAISLGKFCSDDGEEGATLQEQVIKMKGQISDAQTEVATSEMKLKHNKSNLKNIEMEMKKTKGQYELDSKNLISYETQVKEAKSSMDKLNYQEGRLESLMEQIHSSESEFGHLKRNYDSMAARFPWLEFRYRDPEPNFDRSVVRGVAANLFDVKDSTFCVALDTCAGGKLMNVIVNSSVAAGKILKNGNLARRTVMLPLDKISGYTISDSVFRSAQKLVGSDNVFRALDLISFDRSLSSAMEHIFGGSLVVRNLDQANTLAYHREVSKVCVTLEGDVVKPSGDLSGGAASKGGSTLIQIQSLKKTLADCNAKKKQLDSLFAEKNAIKDVHHRYKSLKSVYDQKESELRMIQARLEQTKHHQLGQEVSELTSQCTELEEKISEAKKMEKDSSSKVKDIEYKIKNAKSIKEKELKEAEKEVKQCKKAEAEAKAKWSEKEAEDASLKLEISELKKSILSAEEQLKATEEAISEFEKEYAESSKSVEEMKSDVNNAKKAVKEQKNILNANYKEMNSEKAREENIKKENMERELEIQQLKHKISKATDEAKEAEKTVKLMVEQYEWINDDRQFFGKPNTAYDFSTTDPKEAGRKINKLEETKDKLSKTVNMRAMKMLGKAEEQFNDLMRKKTTVETDKAKICKVIEELDIKKKEELRKAWSIVDESFGKIFSSLLPGAKAKLQPPDGQDVLDGLEVRIGFGEVWKESLSELSGGQRSLVALSLILSLLKFNPAPLYILDEVDAALDLSHTQNIGNMLKKYFKDSQFIVVSLKDGMFNNANVLFRTKFVDGLSTVSRTAQNIRH
ncbi:LOW QUALITY PROTEIN: structural maintenance of chromosomes protein 2-like [Lepeophtheirus salmonis]|uniref:LOW QUALITY PROTEIN: structural maintenance of chromosomes protein 2-like n=1 Tax=Lepeophtheirus salmonis TaxID=72036 RepID=UPI003AF34A0E